VSHLPQRKEKNCLNCGTTVIGKYCHVCGQENIEPKESVLHLISHFFSDITHFDGKFFTSLKDLILKPGFLSQEYMMGKRVSYLNPIRMYLFTSFIFFLIFFSLFKVENNIGNIGANNKNIDAMDSTEFREFSASLNNGQPLNKEEFRKKIDSPKIVFMGAKYKSKEVYDSLLKAGAIKDNWLERIFTHKGLDLQDKYRNNKSQIITDLMNKILHSIPQMLFVLLPLFALSLKILYIRRKNFYYTDHAIFTIHLYIFIFIAMLLIFGLLKIEELTGATWIKYVNLVLTGGIFFYLYKAMRNFYKQGRGRTMLKYFLLLISLVCLFSFVFIILFFISVFEI
jgi:Protein of unknown function (DUF3667)